MAVAPRANSKATKIAYKILGYPKNMELIKKTPREIEIERRLANQYIFDVR